MPLTKEGTVKKFTTALFWATTLPLAGCKEGATCFLPPADVPEWDTAGGDTGDSGAAESCDQSHRRSPPDTAIFWAESADPLAFLAATTPLVEWGGVPDLVSTYDEDGNLVWVLTVQLFTSYLLGDGTQCFHHQVVQRVFAAGQWGDVTPLIITGLPVIEGGEDKVPVDTTLARLPDGRWRAYFVYAESMDENAAIFSAVGAEPDGEFVFEGVAAAKEGVDLHDPTIAFLGGVGHLYARLEDDTALHATSLDGGTTFTPQEGVISMPEMTLLGTALDMGGFLRFYGTSTTGAVATAISRDGSSWEMEEGDVLHPGMDAGVTNASGTWAMAYTAMAQ